MSGRTGAARAFRPGQPTEIETRVRVRRFGARAQWVIAEGVGADALAWPDLAADGHTALGEALAMTAAALAESARDGRQLPAVLVPASDGYPAADVAAGLAALFAEPVGAAATRIAIAIGANADLALPGRSIGNVALAPLGAGNAAELVQPAGPGGGGVGGGDARVGFADELRDHGVVSQATRVRRRR